MALVAALILLLGVAPVARAKPPAASWVVNQYTLQQPVEQQTPGGATQPDQSLWVVNPSACVWDSDDIVSALWAGRIGRGETQAFSVCVIGDWTDHLFRLSVSDGLIGSISASDGPTATSCLLGPDYDHSSPALAPIPDSNGGVGRVHTITFSVHNPGRPQQHAVAVIKVGLHTTQATDLCGPLTRLGGDPVWSVS
jgi:hypothetical protein